MSAPGRKAQTESPVAERVHERKALGLEYATIVWNSGEAILTIGLGIASASLALIGFGSDSIIEIFASLVVIWHLHPRRSSDPQRTRLALRLVAGAFCLLAAALAVAAIDDLSSGRRAGTSVFGIVYLGITALVMFSLATAKRRLADATNSAPLRAEAAMTYLDGILSVATLVGLALHLTLGWWWADPASALLVAFAATNEARITWGESNEK